ncbi:MAG: tetratricopeptide repeat protein [Verrucomicrobiae bacterium]|nr:tetratricopeptide repeat protein [Verrucomicrobiae bacterium]
MTPLVGEWLEAAMWGVVWLAGLCWAGRWVLLRRVELLHHPLNGLVLLAVVVIAIRYGFTEVESAARPGLLRALSAGLLFFIVLQNHDHRGRLPVLMAVMTLSSLILLVVAGWRWWASANLEPNLWRTLVIAPTEKPAAEEVAGVLMLTASLLAAHFFFSRWPPWARVIAIVLIVLVLGAFVLLRSVGVWLGTVAAATLLAHYLMKRRTTRVRWVVTGAVVWVALVAAAIWFLPPVETVQPQPVQSAVWRDAAKTVRGHMWNGVGGGMFEWRYPQVRELMRDAVPLRNDYLELFIAYGASGTAAVLLLIVGVWRAANQIVIARATRYSADTPSNRYAFPIGTMAALAATIVMSALESPFQTPALLLWWAVVGAETLLCAVHPHGLPGSVTEEPGGRQIVWLQGMAKWVGVGFLLVALGFAGWLWRQTTPAQISLAIAKAQHRALAWDEAENWYQRAALFDPGNFRVALALGDFYAALAAWRPGEQNQHLESALRWYAQATQLNPYLADAHAQMGRLYDLRAGPELARKHLNRALELDPRNARYHTLLGQHFARWGDLESARHHYREALESDPSNSTASVELAELIRVDAPKKSAVEENQSAPTR